MGVKRKMYELTTTNNSELINTGIFHWERAFQRPLKHPKIFSRCPKRQEINVQFLLCSTEKCGEKTRPTVLYHDLLVYIPLFLARYTLDD